MECKPVTVFGGSGFLGRQIVKHLAAEGTSIRVAVRHPERACFLERFGRDGQIKLVEADVCDENTVAGAVAQSASVINTVGHYVEKGRATFNAVHAQGALHVARQAAQAGAKRLIHISGLAVDPASDSPYLRARGNGEVLVGKAFDGVTIIRPGVIFGPHDAFFGRLAEMARQTPILPLFGRGRTKLQPVHVGDIAEACVRVLADASAEGKVYECGGPRVYTYRELVQLVLEQADKRRLLVPVPFLIWDMLTALMAFLPNPPLTRDQVRLMAGDNVVGGKASTLQDLGIVPASVEEILPGYINASLGRADR